MTALETQIAALTEENRRLSAKVDYLVEIMTAQGGERKNDLLTLEQIAKRLHVSTRTVKRYVDAGKLPAPTGTGRARRWRVRDLDLFGEAV